MTKSVFAIIVDGQNQVDQIGEGRTVANREARDLRKMGFEVVVKWFATWEEAEAFSDKLSSR